MCSVYVSPRSALWWCTYIYCAVSGADNSSAYSQSEQQFYGRGIVFSFTTAVVGLIPFLLGSAVCFIFLIVVLNNVPT